MRVISINIAQPEPVVINGREQLTGIYKRPLGGPVMLRRLNLAGDGQGDLKNHGGEFKAAYLYPHEHYAYWAQVLRRDGFDPGQFGENFTTEGVLESEIHLGDHLRIGAAIVEAVQPRIPCFKLAHKMDVPDFVAQFQQAGRPGIYLRVVEEGRVSPGDAIRIVRRGDPSLSIHRLNHLFYNWRDEVAAVQAALHSPWLMPKWKHMLSDLLARHGVD
ncbi:MAG: MOSC domain-containing protein [Chloroflexota bacterium]